MINKNHSFHCVTLLCATNPIVLSSRSHNLSASIEVFPIIYTSQSIDFRETLKQLEFARKGGEMIKSSAAIINLPEPPNITRFQGD